jgi:hypothetical protein
MTVMEMLETATDLSEVRIRIFDFNSEEIIFDSDKLKDADPVMEISMSDMADYEVSSFDLYLHNGVINLELNIDYEPEEDDD